MRYHTLFFIFGSILVIIDGLLFDPISIEIKEYNVKIRIDKDAIEPNKLLCNFYLLTNISTFYPNISNSNNVLLI